MRKKSHISLAKYLVTNMKVGELYDHKKAFYLGSILPDLKPSFLTKRHTIDETYKTLIKEIKKITIDYDIEQGINRYYVRHLGVITHYLADYFTFPHNSDYPGTLKEHMTYENQLKFSLREYVKRAEVQRERILDNSFLSVDEILTFIRKTHSEYMNALKNIKVDLQYIVDLCYQVVDAIIYFFEFTYGKLKAGRNQSLVAGYMNI